MNFGHQRTGGVEGEQITPSRFFHDGARHAMRGKNHRRAGIGNLVEFLDEHRALGAQAVDDITVVHDFVTDIDRGPVDFEQALDRFDRPHHPGAKAMGGAEQHPEGGLFRGRCHDVLESARRFGAI